MFLNKKSNKIRNSFVYTSRPERGLHRLLDLWSSITEQIPDAFLFICSYIKLPYEYTDKINKFNNITLLGKLNTDDLYNLTTKSEYWLYPTYFAETGCITAMEMLASEVICLYYPLAGLINTIGDYGIPIKEGNEVNTLLGLTEKQKTEIKKRGKKYGLDCSWENRAKKWNELLNIDKCDLETV